jgi:hypothetical protein
MTTIARRNEGRGAPGLTDFAAMEIRNQIIARMIETANTRIATGKRYILVARTRSVIHVAAEMMKLVHHIFRPR